MLHRQLNSIPSCLMATCKIIFRILFRVIVLYYLLNLLLIHKSTQTDLFASNFNPTCVLNLPEVVLQCFSLKNKKLKSLFPRRVNERRSRSIGLLCCKHTMPFAWRSRIKTLCGSWVCKMESLFLDRSVCLCDKIT